MFLSALSPGSLRASAHWQQSWIWHGRPCSKSTSRPCHFGPIHTGSKVERTFNIRATKITHFQQSQPSWTCSALATMSTTTNCGIQTSRQQSKFNKSSTQLKVDNFVEVDNFVDFRLCRPRQLCRQCVPALSITRYRYEGTSGRNCVASVYRPSVLHATGMKGHLGGEDGSACDEFEG